MSPVLLSQVLPALLAGAAAALLVPGRALPAPAPRVRGLVPGGVLVVGVALAARLTPAVVVAGLTGGALLLGVAVLLRLRRRSGLAAATAARVQEGCESLAEELGAGAGPEQALARAVVDWPALGPVIVAHRLGLDVPDAWRAVADEVPGAAGLRLVAAAWQVSGRTGQGLAAALHRVAADPRAAESSRRVVVSELASARATGRLVAGLPVVAWLMGSGTGGDPLAWLLGGPPGWACLLLGGTLLLTGLAWIELLARAADPA